MADIIGTDGNDTLTGTIGSDQITGLGGNDTLDGDIGADDMAGGTGDDSYYVDNVGDVVSEAANAGTDSVYSHISYTLTANVEKLTLLGDGDFSATGNALDNRLTGNFGDNWLNGGIGADVMIGGPGADTYIVDNAGDLVVEYGDKGIDTVRVAFSYTLNDNLENLTLTGITGRQGSGNAMANLLTGTIGNDVLRGNAGNDVLKGEGGADAMYGGLGDDTFWVNNTGDKVYDYAGQGADTVMSSVTYGLTGTSIENLTLVGSAAINASGNGLDNVLTGNDAANVFSGGGGNDVFAGHGGDDLYWVDSAGDSVVEAAGGGNDTVMSSIDYDLSGSFIENLILTGSSDLSATGNSQANHLVGNSGSNVLDGGFGNDFIDGGAGADRMVGGKGDDAYYVDNTGDVVYEDDNQGNDTVYSSMSYTVRGNVERVVLTGTTDLNATAGGNSKTLIGNSGNNILTVASGNNFLHGGEGDDRLVGGHGTASFDGDLGADTFVFGSNAGTNFVNDFSTSEGDMLDFSAITHGHAASVSTSHYESQGGVTVLVFTFSALGGSISFLGATYDSDFRSHIIW